MVSMMDLFCENSLQHEDQRNIFSSMFLNVYIIFGLQSSRLNLNFSTSVSGCQFTEQDTKSCFRNIFLGFKIRQVLNPYNGVTKMIFPVVVDFELMVLCLVRKYKSEEPRRKFLSFYGKYITVTSILISIFALYTYHISMLFYQNRECILYTKCKEQDLILTTI